MSVAVSVDGSQTTQIGTEHDLATITTANVYVLALDVSLMAGGATPDLVEVREYGKARSGGTERLLKTYTIIGAQSETLFETVPRVSPHHIRYTLKQTQGTVHAYPWAAYKAQ